MSQTISFFYADLLGEREELESRSPTFSTLEEARAFVGSHPRADIIRVESFCYSWEGNNCFTHTNAGKRRPIK